MKRFFIVLLSLSFVCLGARAQEEESQKPLPPTWLNLTNLYYAAHNCTDESKVLQQYMLIPDKSIEEHPELFEELSKFNKEFNQIYINKVAPQEKQELKEDSAEGADNLKEAIKLLRENPDLAAQAGVNIAELEAELAKFNDARSGIDREFDSRTTSQKHLSVNPSSIWRRLYALAVNHKVYTAVTDLGNGLYAANEAPRYNTLAHHSFDKEIVPETSSHKWFIMDEYGRHLCPAQYAGISPRFDVFWEMDLIIVSRPDADGKLKTGALDFKAKERISCKYEGFGGFYDGKILMKRSDGRYDVYNRNKSLVDTM